MKVLTGIYQRDAGTIEVEGQKVEVPNPRAGRDLGISMIHQELVLGPAPHRGPEHLPGP